MEMMVATALFAIVVAFSFGALASLQKASLTVDVRGQSMDQAHLAVEQVESQLRSATVIYDPASENPGGVSNAGTSPDGTQVPVGFSLRIYTQTNGTWSCDQWRLLDNGNLQTRTFSPTWQTDGIETGWRTTATNLVNGSATLDPKYPRDTTPFVLDTSSNYGSRLLDIDLLDNADPTNRSTNVEIKAAITGRDIQYGVTTNACSVIPSP